jgi:hypothetical protein
MTTIQYSQYSKLSVGDLAYLYPSTSLSEGEVGVVVKIDDAKPPHFKLKFPDGTFSWLDYNDVGGGNPPKPIPNDAIAIVKWLYDPAIRAAPPKLKAHREWRIKQVSYGNGSVDPAWVQVEDEWTHRLHWLCKESKYSFIVSGNVVHKVEWEGTFTSDQG